MTPCPIGQRYASGAGALPRSLPGGDAGSVVPDQGRAGGVPASLPSCCTRGGDEPRRAGNAGGDGGGEGRVAPTPTPTPAPTSASASDEAAAAAAATLPEGLKAPPPAEPAREPGAPTMLTTSALAASWRPGRSSRNLAERVGEGGSAAAASAAAASAAAAAAMLLAEVLLTRRRPEYAAGAAGGGARLRDERPAAPRLSTSVRWVAAGAGLGLGLGSRAIG